MKKRTALKIDTRNKKYTDFDLRVGSETSEIVVVVPVLQMKSMQFIYGTFNEYAENGKQPFAYFSIARSAHADIAYSAVQRFLMGISDELLEDAPEVTQEYLGHFMRTVKNKPQKVHVVKVEVPKLIELNPNNKFAKAYGLPYVDAMQLNQIDSAMAGSDANILTNQVSAFLHKAL